MKYEIPESRRCRLHQVRPRFKNDIESVLLFMANQIASLGKLHENDFKEKLNSAIRLYPGNSEKSQDTINNWRTEISALFGFIKHEGEFREPSEIAKMLSDKQDLIEFFRYFLYYFQYPGGYLKPERTQDMIKANIKFHPAKYLFQVFIEGKKLCGESNFGISKAEATHCIFNDLAVVRDNKHPKETAELIIQNRQANLQYDNDGDVIRYAGDILDYMALADLVEDKGNKYYPKMHHIGIFEAFIKGVKYFPSYEKLYTKPNLNLDDIKATQDEWFDFVNSNLSMKIFQFNLDDLQTEENKTDKANIINDFLAKMKSAAGAEERIKAHEIGLFGEALIMQHEKNRMEKLGRDDLVRSIKKLPDNLGVGYDIKSFLGENDEFTNINIEVKTTISKNKLKHQSFHMTSHEWRAATSDRENYFIYRVLISFDEKFRLFIIRDPVGKLERNLLYMEPVGGVNIRYKDESGKFEVLQV